MINCKNCKYCEKKDDFEYWCHLVSVAHLVAPDDFCSRGRSDNDGEKRELYRLEKVNIYDKETIIPNCTVQILENTVTGEVSVGWWRNEEAEK